MAFDKLYPRFPPIAKSLLYSTSRKFLGCVEGSLKSVSLRHRTIRLHVGTRRVSGPLVGCQIPLHDLRIIRLVKLVLIAVAVSPFLLLPRHDRSFNTCKKGVLVADDTDFSLTLTVANWICSNRYPKVFDDIHQ